MNTANRIRELLRERGWTVYRLAKAADMERCTIDNILRRNSSPTIPVIEGICRGFDIPVAEFFAEKAEPSYLTEEQNQLSQKWANLTLGQKEKLLQLMDEIVLF